MNLFRAVVSTAQSIAVFMSWQNYFAILNLERRYSVLILARAHYHRLSLAVPVSGTVISVIMWAGTVWVAFRQDRLAGD